MSTRKSGRLHHHHHRHPIASKDDTEHHHHQPPEPQSSTTTSQQKPIYQLVIGRQNGLSEETKIRESDQSEQKVFVVVKNSPFVIELKANLVDTPTSAANAPPLDLNDFMYDATLVYDYDTSKGLSAEHEVDYVRIEPLQTKFTVNKIGSKVNAECRLKVLSSQREDRHFRVRFRLLDPHTKQPINGPIITSSLALSDAIRAISKPEKSQKRRRAYTRRQPVDQVLYKSLSQIETFQLEQIAKLNMYLSSNSATTIRGEQQQQSSSSSSHNNNKLATSSSSAVSTSGSSSSATNTTQSQKKPKPFGEAFKTLLERYKRLTPDQKVQQIRNVLEIHVHSFDNVFELSDLFVNEGYDVGVRKEQPVAQQNTNTASSSSLMTDDQKPSTLVNGQCTCPDCPAKKQLEQVESFYKDMFAI